MTQRENGARTSTDPAATKWLIDDEVTHLREWGTYRIHALPAVDELTIGAADGCALQLGDPTRCVSRRHARLSRERSGWMLRDLDSKNGTRLDGERRKVFSVEPGIEVSIGRITLIAESPALVALHGFLARLLGFSADCLPALDRALRAVRRAATRRAPLIVCGSGNLVPIAHGLHRRAVGKGRPFVVCDPRRGHVAASVRAAESYPEGASAMAAAAGGTLCLRARRLPLDLREVLLALRDPASRVQLVVCTDDPAGARALLGDPIVITPLARRHEELGRIIDEYASDACEGLGAGPAGFTQADRDWVLEHSVASLPEIEKGTRRLVAIRQAGSISQAASRLGMSHAALSQWVGRRRVP